MVGSDPGNAGPVVFLINAGVRNIISIQATFITRYEDFDKKPVRYRNQSISSFSGKQEVVPLSFEEPGSLPILSAAQNGYHSRLCYKDTYHSFQIEITNAADRETIFHTLSALQDLC